MSSPHNQHLKGLVNLVTEFPYSREEITALGEGLRFLRRLQHFARTHDCSDPDKCYMKEIELPLYDALQLLQPIHDWGAMHQEHEDEMRRDAFESLKQPAMREALQNFAQQMGKGSTDDTSFPGVTFRAVELEHMREFLPPEMVEAIEQQLRDVLERRHDPGPDDQDVSG